jgi:hypothetical protein
MSGPSQDPAMQALQVLVAGTGYNFYDSRSTMRADDLLVRQRASGALADGARALAAQEVEYRRRFIPAATRDNPFPPADAMESLRALGRLRARLDDLAAQILGMPVPAQDKTWWRYREERTTLARLLDFDLQLLRHTEELGSMARALTAEQWQANPSPAAFDALLPPLETLIRERGQFLQIGV